MQINSPNPCLENWEQMTPSGKGRLCDKCSNTVIDFTEMSDGEIKKHFNNHQKVCGRFRLDQLNRPLEHQGLNLKQGVTLAACSLIALSHLNAQPMLKHDSLHCSSELHQHPYLYQASYGYHRKGKSNVIRINASYDLVEKYGIGKLIVETGPFQIPLDSLENHSHFITVPESLEWDTLSLIIWNHDHQEIGRVRVKASELYITAANVNIINLKRSASGWYFARPFVLQPPIIQGIPPIDPPFRFDSTFILKYGPLMAFQLYVTKDSNQSNDSVLDMLDKRKHKVESESDSNTNRQSVSQREICDHRKWWITLLGLLSIGLSILIVLKRRKLKE